MPARVPSRAAPPKPTEEWDTAALRPELYLTQVQYSADFLSFAAIHPGECVIDVGCGPGTLTLPLALAGHSVVAIDFSKAMIDALMHAACDAAYASAGAVRRDACSASATESTSILPLSITPVVASWDDDWRACGVESADVVIASRSVIHPDMDFIVRKMSAFARRRAVLSVTESGTPREDARLLAHLGRKLAPNPDFAAIITAVERQGFEPEIERIVSLKRDTYLDLDAAVEANARAIGVSSQEELAAVREFLEEHLVQWEAGTETSGKSAADVAKGSGTNAARGRTGDASGESGGAVSRRAAGERTLAKNTLAKDYERPITWACIAWNVTCAKK